MNIGQNLQYVAKGCFLAGTEIETPNGVVPIETLKAGDEVISFNEKTKLKEVSKIGSIDIFQKESYYIINDTIKVTGEHPFYTNKGIVEVQNFDSTHTLINTNGEKISIGNFKKIQESVTVYNLLDVLPNNNYYAEKFLVHNKGGGCFLAGTEISTADNTSVYIEDLLPGDEIISQNEITGLKNTSTIERIEILSANKYFIINGKVKATEEHPFYTLDGIKLVRNLKVGDTLLTEGDNELIVEILRKDENVIIYNLINVTPNHNYFADGYLVHNKGSVGGRSSGARSSSTKSTSSSTGKSSPTAADRSANTASSRNTTSAKTAPGSKVTAGGKEVQTSAKAPSKPASQAGIAGVDGYTPRFTNGYTAPAGSVVYYPQHSALDYLPWVYLFSQNSPTNDSAMTVEPTGREVVAQPIQEGVDGLAVFNWILLIVIVVSAIGGIIWGVNKITAKPEPKISGYGYY